MVGAVVGPTGLNFWRFTYFLGKIKFKLLFHGPLAEWVYIYILYYIGCFYILSWGWFFGLHLSVLHVSWQFWFTHRGWKSIENPYAFEAQAKLANPCRCNFKTFDAVEGFNIELLWRDDWNWFRHHRYSKNAIVSFVPTINFWGEYVFFDIFRFTFQGQLSKWP